MWYGVCLMDVFYLYLFGDDQGIGREREGVEGTEMSFDRMG